MARISVHFGAHKTATTYLQSVLDGNSEQFLKDGVSVTTPFSLPKDWMAAFGKFSRSRGIDAFEKIELKESLSNIVPESGRWVFSTEVLCGPAKDMMRSDVGIYRNLNQRLSGLIDLFAEPLTVFFSLRSYDTFYVSIFCEQIRNSGYRPFEELIPKSKMEQFSWVHSVGQFSEVPGDTELVLWCFEDFANLKVEILSNMLGFACDSNVFENRSKRFRRPSLSKQAIESLDRIREQKGCNPTSEDVWLADREFPLFKGFERYDPLSADFRLFLNEKYKRDIAEIKKTWPQIRFLEL